MHSELTQAATVCTRPTACPPMPYTHARAQAHVGSCECAQCACELVHPCVLHPPLDSEHPVTLTVPRRGGTQEAESGAICRDPGQGQPEPPAPDPPSVLQQPPPQTCLSVIRHEHPAALPSQGTKQVKRCKMLRLLGRGG